jgi:hypothetical protein
MVTVLTPLGLALADPEPAILVVTVWIPDAISVVREKMMLVIARPATSWGSRRAEANELRVLAQIQEGEIVSHSERPRRRSAKQRLNA